MRKRKGDTDLEGSSSYEKLKSLRSLYNKRIKVYK